VQGGGFFVNNTAAPGGKVRIDSMNNTEYITFDTNCNGILWQDDYSSYQLSPSVKPSTNFLTLPYWYGFNVSTGIYVCNQGDPAPSGTICTHSIVTQSAGTCVNASLTPDLTTGKCVANPTCPVSSGWSSSFDGTNDVCHTIYQTSCSNGTYDSALGMCAITPTCSNGALDTAADKCYQSQCPTGYVMNATTKACEASPTCSSGTYNTTLNKCTLNYLKNCDTANSYVYNSTNNQCEKTPNCQSGTTYNATTNRCEGLSACTSPAVWNSATGKCVTTYAATATTVGGLTYDNCEGGKMKLANATSYCAGKGMRLPIKTETVAGGGCVPSCSSGYTWTSSLITGSSYYQVWSGSSLGNGYLGYGTLGVRCVK